MKKLFTILLVLLALILPLSSIDNDSQDSYSLENIKVIVKFRTGVFSPEKFQHTIEEILSDSVQSVFKEFDVEFMEAVFRNRYDDSGRIKAEVLKFSNPYFLEGWRVVTLSKDLANVFITKLKQLDEVEEVFIQEPMRIKAAIAPNDPNYAGGGQWHLDDPIFPDADIRAEQAWDINRGRNDVVIAILDGGVDYNHLDMDPGNRSRVITGIDTGDGDNDPLDNLPDNTPGSFAGHGTSVAGVAGAITDNGSQVAGVMWNCRIMPVKMVRSGGIRIPHILNWDWSTSAFPSDVANAIDYAVNNGANIINLSYSFPDMGWAINEVALRVPLLHQAIDNAYKNNVVITASMGNEFETDNSIRYPAGFREQVMAVGATTRTRERAAFSNTGFHISVSAPGVGIVTTERGGGVRTVSGTSFSAPLTAGVAGLVISQGRDRNFNLTNDDVRHIIELTAQDIGAIGYDNETGHGIVNARNALQLIDEPNMLYQYNSVGGTQTFVQNFSQWILLSDRWGLAAGTYINVDQYKITKHVTFQVPFCSPPTVWMRERESKSLDYGNPNSGRPQANITNITNTGFDLEYVAYFVRYNILSQQINTWIPAAPASTNVAYTTVGVPNLAAVAGPINGPSLICSTGLYTLQNPPQGSSIVWTSSNSNGLSINPSTGAATRVNNFNGSITITANVNSGCGNLSITRNIWVGTPQITNQKIDGGSYFPGMQICPGNHWLSVTPIGGNASVATWTVPQGIPYFVGTNTLDFTFPFNSNSVAINARSSNSCGQGANYAFYLTKKNFGCTGSYSMAIYPNPTSNYLNVEIFSATSTENENLDEKPVIEKATLIDSNGNKVAEGKHADGKVTFNIQGIRKGVYFLHVTIDNTIIKEQVLIQ
ncbi:MAG: S8 family serine peptidase [Fischerella sp.]|nr:S8 family serine peptidase [Fischerella sp.]